MITGANGFIGSWVTLRFAQAGWQVYAGARTPAAVPSHANVLPFEWNVPLRCTFPTLPEEAPHPRVCLHLAFTTQHSSQRQRRSGVDQGTLLAKREAERNGARQQVFVSSCSAHKAALSQYGKSKYATEREFRGPNDLVVRPALVLGNGGLFARMVKTLQKSPVVPLFDGGRQPVQVIHRDDLGEVLFQAIAQNRTGRIIAAAPGVLSMRRLMNEMATALGKHPKWVPIRSAWVLLIVRGAERKGLNLPVTSENLLGLMAMKAQKPSDLRVLLGKELGSAREVLVEALRDFNDYSDA